jgi:hypothetical protein
MGRHKENVHAKMERKDPRKAKKPRHVREREAIIQGELD